MHWDFSCAAQPCHRNDGLLEAWIMKSWDLWSHLFRTIFSLSLCQHHQHNLMLHEKVQALEKEKKSLCFNVCSAIHQLHDLGMVIWVYLRIIFLASFTFPVKQDYTVQCLSHSRPVRLIPSINVLSSFLYNIYLEWKEREREHKVLISDAHSSNAGNSWAESHIWVAGT